MKGVYAFLLLATVMVLTVAITLSTIWLVRHSIEPYRSPEVP